MLFAAVSNVQNLQNSLILLLLGMGTVFVFLGILIAATKITSKIVKKFAPAKQPVKPAQATVVAPQVAAGAGNDAEIAAAIAAAFVEYKK